MLYIQQGTNPPDTLNIEARRELRRIVRDAHKAGFDVILTSTTDAAHSDATLHWVGDAFDYNLIQKVKRVPVNSAFNITRHSTRPGFDHLPENSHIHCEFDPK